MSEPNKNGSDPPKPLDAGLQAAFGLGSVLALIGAGLAVAPEGGGALTIDRLRDL